MSHHRYHSSAPFAVKSLAVVVAVDGLLSLLDALSALRASLLLALVFATVGCLHIALAYGLWQLEPYAYSLGFVVFGVGLLVDLLNGKLVGAFVSATTLSLLYHNRDLYRS